MTEKEKSELEVAEKIAADLSIKRADEMGYGNKSRLFYSVRVLLEAENKAEVSALLKKSVDSLKDEKERELLFSLLLDVQKYLLARRGEAIGEYLDRACDVKLCKKVTDGVEAFRKNTIANCVELARKIPLTKDDAEQICLLMRSLYYTKERFDEIDFGGVGTVLNELALIISEESDSIDEVGLQLLIKTLRDGFFKRTKLDICKRDFGYEWKKFVELSYKYRLRADVLRGENELTGNLIAVGNDDGCGILLECGKSICGTEELSEIERQVLATPYLAIIVSHGHADHDGLVDKATVPVYMGETTRNLYRLRHKNSLPEIRTYRDGVEFSIGSLKITPYFCDHSAPDSFMLLIEDEYDKILYTGDFRSHGRKNYSKLLARLPEKVDLLITENTNGRNENKQYFETAIERLMQKTVEKSDKPVFLLCPTTAADRIVSAYKATVKAKRDFLVDLDEEEILETVGGGMPNAKEFSKVKVYYTGKRREGKFLDVKNKSVSIAELAERNDFVMLIKTSSLGYIKKLAALRNGLNGATLIYSMWSGYKTNATFLNFFSEIEKLGIAVTTIHTSGHADKEAIAKLISRTNPDRVIYVHEREDA